MIPNIVANWADPLDGTISVSDPRDWYVEPFGFSQDELDVDAMDDDAVFPTQEPPMQPEQPEDVPMATEDTAKQAKPLTTATNATGQPIILDFPNKSPLLGKTHLHGCWIPSNSPNGPPEKWAYYFPPLTIDQGPTNLI